MLWDEKDHDFEILILGKQENDGTAITLIWNQEENEVSSVYLSVDHTNP